MSLFRHSVTSAAAAAVSAGGRFVLMAIVARRISSVAFGQFVYALWLVDVAFLLCAFGMNGSATRHLAEFGHDSPRRASFLRWWLRWALTLPVLAGAVAMGGAILSGMRLAPMALVLLVVWTIAAGWLSMQTGALFGYQRFDLVLRANVASSGLAIAAASFLPISDATPEVLFGTMAAASLVGCVFGMRQHVVEWGSSVKDGHVSLPWPTIRAYAINVWITGLLGALVWSRGELPIVRAALGDEGVAHYGVALTLFFGASQGIMLWVSGVAPHLTSAWGLGRRIEALSTARGLADVQMLGSGVAAIALIWLGPELLHLAFGASYRSSVSSLVILALGLITLSASTQNHLLQIDTNARFTRNASVVGLIVLYSIASVTTPWLGIVGAASARVFTMGALFVVTLMVVWRRWGPEAFSGRNAIRVTCITSLPALILVRGDIAPVYRAVIAAGCVVVLLASIRSETGRSVALNIIGAGWLRVTR